MRKFSGGISLNGVELNLSSARRDVNIKRLSILRRARRLDARENGQETPATAYSVDKDTKLICMQYIKVDVFWVMNERDRIDMQWMYVSTRLYVCL